MDRQTKAMWLTFPAFAETSKRIRGWGWVRALGMLWVYKDRANMRNNRSVELGISSPFKNYVRTLEGCARNNPVVGFAHPASILPTTKIVPFPDKQYHKEEHVKLLPTGSDHYGSIKVNIVSCHPPESQLCSPFGTVGLPTCELAGNCGDWTFRTFSFIAQPWAINKGSCLSDNWSIYSSTIPGYNLTSPSTWECLPGDFRIWTEDLLYTTAGPQFGKILEPERSTGFFPGYAKLYHNLDIPPWRGFLFPPPVRSGQSSSAAEWIYQYGTNLQLERGPPS